MRGEKGVAGIVDGAAKLLSESLGFGVGKFKVHDPDMGARSASAKPEVGLPMIRSPPMQKMDARQALDGGQGGEV
jgi:hypothetical protein